MEGGKSTRGMYVNISVFESTIFQINRLNFGTVDTRRFHQIPVLVWQQIAEY